VPIARTHTLLKSLAVLAGLFSLIGIASPSEHKYYIGNADRSLVFQVPPDIVASKDCERYQAFVHSLVRPLFVPDDTCPWPWSKVTSVAHFTMKGVKVEVPREYLFSSRGTPDGETGGISFLFRYPGMEPTSADGDQSHNILVGLKIRGYCRVLPCKEEAAAYFLKNKIREQVEPSQTPTLIEKMAGGLALYGYDKAFKRGYSMEFYIKGDPLQPDYWLWCPPSVRPDEVLRRNPRCDGVIDLADNLYATYSFRKKPLLDHQLEIQQGIRNRLQSFIMK
jgi:hypothetical protein